jgi:hypothetical protein
MGRNGQNAATFTKIVDFVNENVGKVVSSYDILLGRKPGRNSATAYLYKFVKLGYVKPVNGGFIMHKDTMYEIVKPFPPHYNSVACTYELRIANGLIPDSNDHELYEYGKSIK